VASKAAAEGEEVASTAKRQARRVASTATDKGQEVAQTTAEDAKAVAGTAKAQAAEVAQEATARAGDLVEQAKGQVQEQAVSQLQRLAESLSRLGEEALALADGRPDEAPTVTEYVSQAGDKLLGAADSVHEMGDDLGSRGIGGLKDDVERFARSRPGLFLLGAALAGFGVGRAMRSGGENGQSAGNGQTVGGEQAAPPAVTRRRAPSQALPAGQAGPPAVTRRRTPSQPLPVGQVTSRSGDGAG
jgi:hypothetical protein